MKRFDFIQVTISHNVKVLRGLRSTQSLYVITDDIFEERHGFLRRKLFPDSVERFPSFTGNLRLQLIGLSEDLRSRVSPESMSFRRKSSPSITRNALASSRTSLKNSFIDALLSLPYRQDLAGRAMVTPPSIGFGDKLERVVGSLIFLSRLALRQLHLVTEHFFILNLTEKVCDDIKTRAPLVV